MKQLQIPLYLFVCLFMLSGCLSQGSSDHTSIPDVTVECSSAMVFAPHCRNTGERLFIGLTNEFALDCANALSSFSRTVRNDFFQAIAEDIGLTKTGTLVRAQVTSWANPRGSSVVSLTEGPYKVCAFIEQVSGNGRLDLGEPIGSGVINVGGSSPQLVNDWISY